MFAEGRWTLIDTFDKGGSLYIMARENRPPLDGLEALSERERQVVEHLSKALSTKEIAYALGISAVTVRVLICRAMAKLGATSRSSLLAHVTVRPSPSAAGSRDDHPEIQATQDLDEGGAGSRKRSV